MWCRNCNIETNEELCPICGHKTEADTPADIMWCKECNIPIIQEINSTRRGLCPLCGSMVKRIASDLRPVFPEERLLLELLLGKQANEYHDCSVWAANNRYYIDGRSVSISNKAFQEADTNALRANLEKYAPTNSYDSFNNTIDLFVKANADRFHMIKDEAAEFVKDAASKYEEEKIVISFSGGKDSTATADVVTKSLSNPSLVHIFGDTTLEFPSTIEYVNRYINDHPQCTKN